MSRCCYGFEREASFVYMYTIFRVYMQVDFSTTTIFIRCKSDKEYSNVIKYMTAGSSIFHIKHTTQTFVRHT